MTKKEIVEMLKKTAKIYRLTATGCQEYIIYFKKMKYLPSSIKIAKTYLEKCEDRAKMAEALYEKARSK